jgi:ubiquinone/menaquinone biosynthesis C-methylase UbiE
MLRFNYDKVVDIYDSFELSSELNEQMTHEVAKILKGNSCQKVWDAACGTGAQAIPLCKAGFDVMASDINPVMLSHAKEKATELHIDFFQSDMTQPCYIKADAVIALYNALGHLSKDQFYHAAKSFYKLLPPEGLFIGDVDNRAFLEVKDRLPDDYFLSSANKDLGWQRFSKATVGEFGIYHMSDRWIKEDEIKISEKWDLQTWYKDELEDELYRAGFSVIEWHDRQFSSTAKTAIAEQDSLLFVAQKND